MSNDTEKGKASAAPSNPAKGGGAVGKLLGILVPAIVAGAASFGGTRVAGAHHAAAQETEAPTEASKPPGPTLALEPFVFTISDTAKKAHPMKVTLAIEFDSGTSEESLKSLTPRVRDGTLSALRTLTYEEATDPTTTEKMRSDLLAAIKTSGASGAHRVLITDLVVQ